MLPNELVIIPCNDANGYSSKHGGVSECSGKFFSDFWGPAKTLFPTFYDVISLISAETMFLARRGIRASVVRTRGSNATFHQAGQVKAAFPTESCFLHLHCRVFL